MRRIVSLLVAVTAIACGGGGDPAVPTDLALQEMLGQYAGIVDAVDGKETFTIGISLEAIVLALGEPGTEAFGSYSTSSGTNGDVRIKRIGPAAYRIRLFQSQPCAVNFVGTFKFTSRDSMDGSFDGSSPCTDGTTFDFTMDR